MGSHLGKLQPKLNISKQKTLLWEDKIVNENATYVDLKDFWKEKTLATLLLMETMPNRNSNRKAILFMATAGNGVNC